MVMVEFNERMDATTLTSGNIAIYADPLVELENNSYSYVDSFNLLKVNPSGYLDVNTRYSVVIRSTVQDYHGNTMASDFWWNFWTGQPSGYVYASGDQLQPDEIVLSGYLDVVDTFPANYTSNIPLGDVSPIYIRLSDTCGVGARNYFGDASGISPFILGLSFLEDPAATLSGFISIENAEVLGNPIVAQTAPSYTITAEDNIIRIDGTGWLNNNEYIVRVKSGLPGLYTNPMANDYFFVFTGNYTPLYTGANIIRLNIGPMLQMAMAYIPDDTLLRFIYEASVQAERLYPYTVAAGSPPWYLVEYVIYQTKINALYAAIMIFCGSGAGVRRRLADLEIELDARALMPALLPILSDLREKRDEMEEMVISGDDEEPGPIWVVKSGADARRPITAESWRRLPMTDFREDVGDVESKIKWLYVRDISGGAFIGTRSKFLAEGRYVTV